MSSKQVKGATKNLKIPIPNPQISDIRQQDFPLPDSIIHYAAKNISTPKLSQNLFKSCKYFFLKNTVLAVHCLSFDEKEGWKTCSCIGKSSCAEVNGMKGPPCHLMYNIDFESIKSKIWITNSLIVANKDEKFVSSILMPKVFQCDVFGLDLKHQAITFKEYLYLTSEVRRLVFFKVIVTKEDGTVAKENELRKAPKALMFGYYYD